ncbi:hypothetical protein J2S21_000773 [Peribacillus cavernae]|nr:hypothetical protein [Peribacillus cavernae]
MKRSYRKSGGIYNLLHFEESMEILDAKMKHAENTHAATIVTTIPAVCCKKVKNFLHSAKKNLTNQPAFPLNRNRIG